MQKHKSIFTTLCDTEVLEKSLEEACSGNLQVSYRLELRRLATLLRYDAAVKKQGAANQHHIEPLKALTNFKANLRRRKKTSDIMTSSRLMEIPEPARAILLSDIAFVFWNDIDDYTQIDFSNAKHVELLSIAVDNSISKVSNRQGRPGMNHSTNSSSTGELAALLKLGTEPKKEHPQAESQGVQITMVAGAGFEPATFRL